MDKIKPPRYAYFAYKTKGRARFFGIASDFSVCLVVFIYVFCTLGICVSDILRGVGFVLVTGLSFAVLTLSRRLIDAKRPYELYDLSDIESELLSRRVGLSFPSRHVFSAFLIGTVLVFTSVPLGVIVLSLGVFIAVARVILLIHFPRDVIAGAVIGVFAGVIGAIALKFLI